MKSNLKKIKFVLGLLVFIAMVCFTSVKNSDRKISEISVKFVNSDENHFLNEDIISNIINKGETSIYDRTLGNIDLKNIEDKINNSPYVDYAEVNKDISGKLNFDIKVRNPVARVRTQKEEYYVSDEGEKMPLSRLNSPFVNLVYGEIKDEELKELSDFVNYIRQDELFEKHIISIVKINDNQYNLIVNDHNFYIELGSLEDYKIKLKNLKLFYNQYLDYVNEGTYKKISLKYINQVVATKNEQNEQQK